MTNNVQKIRENLKNINTDDEIDEIHKILDRLDGRLLLEDSMISETAADIVKKGHVEHVEIMNEVDSYQKMGQFGASLQPTGVVRAEISIVASMDDIYDD